MKNMKSHLMRNNEEFNKAYGIFHWDTFDNVTILIGEADTLLQAQQFVQNKYKNRLSPNGADQVDIVDRLGNIVEKYSTQ